ncbi:MAG: TetR/AcrR family transcriptional regulator [Actinomycetota bacterium]|nr:TetR/AcrR family transcriptional regulator [Actinomycetota bacterium]
MLTEARLIKERAPGGSRLTRAEKKQRTRLQLIEAALDVMAERGITATRTIDVAKRAGVAHGTVFVHFPTREDLITAVVDAHARQIGGRLHELAGDSATVRDVLTAHLAGLVEHEAFYARLVMEGPLLPAYPRATLLGIQSAISAHLAEAAEREMAAGRVRRMPVYLLFNTWLGLVHHYLCNRELFAPGESVLERWGPTLLNHYLGLIGPDEEGGE